MNTIAIVAACSACAFVAGFLSGLSTGMFHGLQHAWNKFETQLKTVESELNQQIEELRKEER